MIRGAVFGLLLAFCIGVPTEVQAQRVSGTVVDRVTRAPVSGATVSLLGRDHQLLGSVTTDDRGRFGMSADEDGDYLLFAQVGGYTSLLSEVLTLSSGVNTDYEFAIETIAALPGEEEPVDLDAQTLAEALALVCESQYDRATQGILVGVVRDSVSALPLPDVTTSLRWIEDGEMQSRDVITGDDGTFVFCDAPAGPDRLLSASLAGLEKDTEPFRVNAGMLKRRDVLMSMSNSGRPGDILGLITDYETGSPIAGAEIRLRDTDFVAVTRDDGGFAFADVPWGVYFLEISHIAYQDQATALRVVGDKAHEVDVALASEAMELDPISVQIRGRDWFSGMRGFRERKSRGFGYFMDAIAIERRGAVRTLDLLREIPGVNVEMARSSTVNPGRTTTQAIYFRNCWRYTESGDQIFTPPVFYLNGVKQISVDLARGDLDTVRPDEIEAIEVYRGAAEVPADFGGSDAGCGVIAIWTKRG